MKIRTDIIERIRGRKDIIPLIASEMRVKRSTVKTWLNFNLEDGSMTKTKVMAILREKLQLTDDQILEAETQTSTN